MAALSNFEIELKLLLEAIYLKYGHDFRGYAMSSLQRRVESALFRFGCATVCELLEKVLYDPKVFTELLQLLTVTTTEMFRDPDYFLLVRKNIVPFLRTYPSIKIWIAGCSTGEELYSIAVLLAEEELLNRSIIYATDINSRALDQARTGIFSKQEVEIGKKNYISSGGKGRLEDYYVESYGSVQFDRSLVENVVFADHSLATDHVFSEVHFVSCRNVLIYFRKELQDRALQLFSDSLCHGGFLGLGSKEAIRFTKHCAVFQPVAPDAVLFQKKQV